MHLRIILPFSESSTSITLVDVARAPPRPRISHFRPSIAFPNNVTEGSGALCPCMNFNRAGGGARQIVCSGHVNRRKKEAQRVEKEDGSRQEKGERGKHKRARRDARRSATNIFSKPIRFPSTLFETRTPPYAPPLFCPPVSLSPGAPCFLAASGNSRHKRFPVLLVSARSSNRHGSRHVPPFRGGKVGGKIRRRVRIKFNVESCEIRAAR